MTENDNTFELSRRKALAGLGTIGVASAGAGLGTTAFFSDEETFEDNSLTAGALDLKVDWEEHYYDESAGAQYVEYSDPGDEAFVGFPDPSNPLVWIHEDDVDAFMDATSIEAFPDDDNDGIQDDLEGYDECADFADMDEDLDPSGLRSDNDDTRLGDDSPAPLVNLDDVKPGDSGELTLSFHLCDNPGYVWLNGAPVEASENGHTEPEGKDGDEIGAEDEVATGADVLNSDVELLDEIETLLWYDEDGDNVFEPGGGTTGEADVVLVLDRSGSMSGSAIANAKAAAKTLVDELGGDTQVGLVSFSSSASLDQQLTTDKQDVKDAIDALSATGTTNMSAGISSGSTELQSGANARAGADKIMVVLGDGRPNSDSNTRSEASAAKDDGIEIFTVAFGGADEQLMEDIASDPAQGHAFVGQESELEEIFSQIGQILTGEEAFFRGSLRELLGAVSTDFGIPLDGNRATEYDEVDANNVPNDGADDAREHFVNSTNNFVGLAWWLPVDHANEIQTDSVSFDLGFYTEQSRHNDGSGQAPESSA